tara:strand:- start:9094 stop:9831 length:738 start_codon:yes stop_codon:yes gene_type:complete
MNSRLEFSKSHSKLINSLRSKKVRWEKQLFIAETPKVIKEFISENFDIVFLFTVDNSFFSDLPESIIFSKEELKKNSVLDSPQECIAILGMKEIECRKNSWSIILDRVQDPGNLGALIRLADWFGVDWLAIPPGTVDPFSPKVIHASMGSLARVPLRFETDSELLITLAQENKNIYLADMSGEKPKDILKSKSGCLVLGNEGNGPSDFWKKKYDYVVTINKATRSKTESLNVATAAAILLYEINS